MVANGERTRYMSAFKTRWHAASSILNTTLVIINGLHICHGWQHRRQHFTGQLPRRHTREDARNGAERYGGGFGVVVGHAVNIIGYWRASDEGDVALLRCIVKYSMVVTVTRILSAVLPGESYAAVDNEITLSHCHAIIVINGARSRFIGC